MTFAIPLFLLIGYLIGSIPFGLILTKIFLKQDIRKIGSGNIGTTNVLRTGNKPLAIATLVLDMLKGAVLILLIVDINANDPAVPDYFGNAIALIIGLGAVIGHCFPVWLKFKGGKGVATTFGVLFAAVPYAGISTLITWIVVAFTTKYSSLAALCAYIAAPIATFFIYGAEPAALCFLISALIWVRHIKNIKSLLNGTETKIHIKTKEKQ